MYIATLGFISLITLGSLKVGHNYYKDQIAPHVFCDSSLAKQETNPDTTIILFDMHKVFMEQNFFSIYSNIVSQHGKELIPLLCYPSSYKNGKAIAQECKVGEHICEKLEELYPQLQGIKKTLQESFIADQSMPDTIKIIRDLKAKGYKLYVLSNCAEETFKLYQEKYADIFALFDGAYLPCQKNGFDHKPRASFFRGCKDYLIAQGHGDKRCIFIDDNHRNIHAAVAALPELMTGVHFTSASRLTRDLAELEKSTVKAPQTL